MKLYEISAEVETLLDECTDLEQVPEQIQQRLEELSIDFDTKVESLAAWIKGMEADAEAIKAEEERLHARRKAIENSCSWFRNYIALHTGSGYKLKTARFTIFSQTRESVEIPENFDLKALAEAGFATVVTTYKPNKTAIKDALKASQGVLEDEAGNTVQIVSKTSIVIR